MSGFDAEKVQAEFFADTPLRINMVCAIGHGDPEKVYGRSPPGSTSTMSPSSSESGIMSDQDQLQHAAIDSLIQRERIARDAGRWDEMAGCYHPDSRVEVSWFQGSGREFAERSRNIAGGKVYTFHQMSPAVVTLNGRRALADTGCSVHGLTDLDGVEVDIVSHSRLLWRALRTPAGLADRGHARLLHQRRPHPHGPRPGSRRSTRRPSAVCASPIAPSATA